MTMKRFLSLILALLMMLALCTAALAENEGEEEPEPTEVPGSAPVVTKSPTDDSAHEGGDVLFIAKADNVDSYAWYCTVNGSTYSMSEACSAFSGLSVSGDGTGRLTLSNVPRSLYGASFFCSFTNAYGTTNSGAAILYVLEPLPPSAAPTQAPAPTAAPTQAPAPTAAPAHEHEFTKAWKYDNETHWHECTCGEKGDEAAHEVQEWATNADGSQLGVCLVCGAAVTREAAPDATPAATPAPQKTGLSRNGWVLLVLLVVIVAVVATGLFLLFRMRSREAKAAVEERPEDQGFNPENPHYNPRHDGIHDEEDRAEYYRKQLENYEKRK